mgnify:CR=1 FL=1
MGCEREARLTAFRSMANLAALFEDRPNLFVETDLRLGPQHAAAECGGDAETSPNEADPAHQS